MKKFLRRILDRAIIPALAYVFNRLYENHNVTRRANVFTIMQERAAIEFADYVEKHMPGALHFLSREELWRYAWSRKPSEGLVLEFGVFQGHSINFLAGLPGADRIVGFDSFEGLREDWAGSSNRKGAFDVGGRMPAVKSNVTLVKGWFDATLPRFLEENHGPVAYAHLDADTYEATAIVLPLLLPRLRRGTIIVFDEYIGYRGWRQGEHRAWQEFCAKVPIRYDYIGFANGPVAVVLTSIG